MTPSSKPWGEELLAERARRLAERPTQERVERRRVCICEAGGEIVGLPVEDIARVLPFAPPAPLANAEPSLLGIIGCGGSFVLVYDLAALIGASDALTPEAHLVLLRRQRPMSAFKVARTLIIEDIEILGPDEAASLPVRAGVGAYGRHDGAIVSIIDINALTLSRAQTISGG